ncbi:MULTISPECIES: hypothetical protein [unclassified Caulobacter]|jgi:hypothetical protein|uniref:hypothetical protein n=1 Tax=unclassified Caulobacter TaxID=2648921 RepID=UPI00078436FB|nr:MULTISPECIES: hypothetical protein [unclassified Caulobacter]AZS22098.1 hypothetical protein CSW63_16480 [Caulobacter sp. FWC26]|tara:strand:+ start:74 stop:418 length:345 start_codon:yes stop_codon:yes gene_type:complete
MGLGLFRARIDIGLDGFVVRRNDTPAKDRGGLVASRRRPRRGGGLGETIAGLDQQQQADRHERTKYRSWTRRNSRHARLSSPFQVITHKDVRPGEPSQADTERRIVKTLDFMQI